MANWDNISKLVRDNVDTALVEIDAEQRNWVKMENAEGVRVYLQRPGKRGETRKVHVSMAGYGPKFGDVTIPGWVTRSGLPGNVAFEIDLDRPGAPALLVQILKALPEVGPEARASSRRGGAKAAPIDVAASLGVKQYGPTVEDDSQDDSATASE